MFTPAHPRLSTDTSDLMNGANSNESTQGDKNGLSRDNDSVRYTTDFSEIEKDEESGIHLTEKDLVERFEIPEPQTQFQQFKSALQKVANKYIRNQSWWGGLFWRSFPIAQAIKDYKKESYIGDISAGLSTGAAAIPLGMSYSLLAGLDPINGLYNQLVYCFIYMILGSGRQVCVGSSPVESMMSAAAVALIVGVDATKAIFLSGSVLLAFFVGIGLLLMRLIGLGVIATFLADPVVSGFSTGCVFIVGSSQLQHFFNIKDPKLNAMQTIGYMIFNLHRSNWICILIGSTGILILVFFKYVNDRWLKRFPLPSSVVIVILFTSIGALLRIDDDPYNVPIIGDIPKGLPWPTVPNFNLIFFPEVLQQAAWYCVVYFFIHTSIAKTVAQRNGYVIDYDQELLALGTCSLVGSFFSCFAPGTSITRTSIAFTTGAKTQLYNVGNFLTILICLLFLTPYLYYLPKASLASVILYGVYFMLSFREGYRLMKLFSLDFLLWLVCFLVTSFAGAMIGIITSVILSLVWIIKDDAFPSTRVLGRLPGTNVFRNIQGFPEAREISGCKILQFDASLNFSNSFHFEKKIYQLVGLSRSGKDIPSKNLSNLVASPESHLRRRHVHPIGSHSHTATVDHALRVVIIEASSINRVDVTAIRTLEGISKNLQRQNIILLFANWKGPAREFLEKAKFYDCIPMDRCFTSVNDAVLWAESFILHQKILPSSMYLSNTPETFH